MITEIHDITVHAEYRQFLVGDANHDGEIPEIWSDEAVQRGLAVDEDVVAIATRTDDATSVRVELHDVGPAGSEDRAGGGRTCSIATPSRAVVIHGSAEDAVGAFSLPVPSDRMALSAIEGDGPCVLSLWPTGSAFMAMPEWTLDQVGHLGIRRAPTDVPSRVGRVGTTPSIPNQG